MTFLTFAILNSNVVNESFAQNISTSLFQVFIVISLVKARKRQGRHTRRTKKWEPDFASKKSTPKYNLTETWHLSGVGPLTVLIVRSFIVRSLPKQIGIVVPPTRLLLRCLHLPSYYIRLPYLPKIDRWYLPNYNAIVTRLAPWNYSIGA